MTAGPPSVAIRVAATLPSNAASIGRRLRATACSRQVPAFPAIAAIFTSASATGASASRAGAAGVSALVPCRSSGFAASACIGSAGSARPASRARPAGRPAVSAGAVLGRFRNCGGTDIVRRLLGRPADRRAAAPASAAGRRSAGQTPARAAPVATEGWQIPHARRATGRRRQARTPGPTSTARSRRTGNENRGAWTRVPPCLMSAGPLMPRERGDHCVTGFAGSHAANQAELRISQRLDAFCYKICGQRRVPSPVEWRFSDAVRHLCRSSRAITK